MRRKIIYVDFIKKRRITFVHFTINKLLSLLINKFSLKFRPSNNIDLNNIKRISN